MNESKVTHWIECDCEICDEETDEHEHEYEAHAQAVAWGYQYRDSVSGGMRRWRCHKCVAEGRYPEGCPTEGWRA